MTKLLLKLEGKKTYLISIAGVVYAITGVVAGYMNPQEALEIVMASLGLSALRAGVSK